MDMWLIESPHKVLTSSKRCCANSLCFPLKSFGVKIADWRFWVYTEAS